MPIRCGTKAHLVHLDHPPSPTAQLKAMSLSLNTAAATRLPAELLQQIFFAQLGFVAARDAVKSFHRCVAEKACGPMCWITVSHVCAYWREVALRCPTLWSCLAVPSDPEWMAEMLRRSCALPLTADAKLVDRPPNPGREQSLELMLMQLYRIKTLRITSVRPVSQRCAELLNGPAPVLRCLRVNGVLLKHDDALDGTSSSPAMLARDKTPNLEELSLGGDLRADSGVRIRGPCAETLTCLRICVHGRTGQACWPSVPELMQILGTVPSLDTLVFDRRVAGRAEPVDADAVMPQELPRLHTLSLSSHAAECATLLNSLGTPSLRVLCVWASSASRHFDALAPAIAQKIGVLEPTIALEVAGFRKSPHEPLWLLGRVSNESNAANTVSTRSRLSFDITLHNLRDHGAAIVDLFPRLSLGEVETLGVEGDRIPEAAWIAMVENLDKAKALMLDGLYTPAHLPEILRVRPAPGLVDTDAATPVEAAESAICHLPNLREIWLNSACLSRETDYRAGQLGAWATRFCEVLRERAERGDGTGLRYMRLRQCTNISPALLEALRSVVLDKVESPYPEEGFLEADIVLPTGERYDPRGRETFDWDEYMPV